MKVIFLDIDGPLSVEPWMDCTIKINKSLTIPHALEKEEVNALKKIIDCTGAKIVISSDWRKHFTLLQIRSILEFYGIPRMTVIAMTHMRHKKINSSNKMNRAYQIIDWINAHKKKIEAWVSIDDYALHREFEYATEQQPHITKENHFQKIGDFSNIMTPLRDLTEKIITKLNDRNKE